MINREGIFGRREDRSREKASPPATGTYPPPLESLRRMPNAASTPTQAAGSPAPLVPEFDTPASPQPASPPGSRLVVGPNIRLKGVEITECDTVVVEGHVEATLDSRAMQIAPGGTYSGAAGLDEAEIRGNFSGELTVRKCLTIHATGRVSGKVRYGRLVIAEGGEISGEIQSLNGTVPARVTLPVPLALPVTAAPAG